MCIRDRYTENMIFIISGGYGVLSFTDETVTKGKHKNNCKKKKVVRISDEEDLKVEI